MAVDMLRRTLLLAWSAMIFALAAAPIAQADPNYDSGVQLYTQRNYKAAVESFAKIDGAQSQPKVIYYQALCYHQMKNAPAAIKLYKQLVANYPNTQEAQTAALVLQKIAGPTGAGAGTSAFTGGTVKSGAVSTQVSAGTNVSSDILPEQCGVMFHRGPSGHMFVNATVGGRPMEVMFDTGASSCYFGKDQLIKAGAKFTSTGQKTESLGVGGTVESELCLIEIQLGDIRRTIPVMVAANSSLSPLLGQNFFNPFRYDVDTSVGVIHFNKKGGGNHQAFDTLNVPFTPIGDELEVTVSVNGHSTKAYFDTGAGPTMFSMAAATQAGISIPHDATPVMVNGVGGGSIGFKFRVDRVDLGPVQKSNMEITVSPTCQVSLIGQDFFRDKRFTIDNEAHLIRFAR